MRKESLRLLEQGSHDINTAVQLLKINIYYASLSFAEKAVERAIKALHIEKKRKVEYAYDLVELAQGVDAPHDVLKAVDGHFTRGATGSYDMRYRPPSD